MKKKILALCLVVVLAVTAVTGATLAYFTDTDAAKNVMTTGNVDIKQLEEQRYYNEDGSFNTLGDFEDNKKLYPVTGYDKEEGTYMETWGTEYMFKNTQNHVDKVVSVTNVGSEDAYVRTLFAFEMLNIDGKWVDPIDAFETHALYLTVKGSQLNPNGISWPKNSNDGYGSLTYGSGSDYCHVMIGDKLYVVGEYYYGTDSKLAPEERSHASLLQVALEETVTNEQAAYFQDYEILVLSQAAQTAGFADAKTALNTAFGDLTKVDATTLQKWFAECK